MQPRGFDPLNPKRKPELRTADRPFETPDPAGDDPDRQSADGAAGRHVVARTQALAVRQSGRRSVAKQTQEALALRAEGFSVAEVAESMGVAPSTVTKWLTKHRRALEEDEIDKQLDEIAVPLATENLIHGLIAGDKDYTLKTLEGRGKLKRHSDRGDVPDDLTLPALVIRVEGGQAQINMGVPPPGSGPVGGHIVGTPAVEPKQVEGQVVDAKPDPPSD